MFFESQPGPITELLTGRSWNSREITTRVGARIQCLQSSGLGRGDRVFVHYGNKPEFFVDLLAVWYLGASLVPIDNRLTAFEIENLARAVTPRLMLTDAAADDAMLARLKTLGVHVIDTAGWIGSCD
ncbi:MAG TPA: AMP-binding protein, partial [Candidatus Limnocylindria bacterium]|nr:AMP-binding protein [Candidatus Limnocylindria bacterium]